MRKTIGRGIVLMTLMWGLGASEAFAQSPPQGNGNTQSNPITSPPQRPKRRVFSPSDAQTKPTGMFAFQEVPPAEAAPAAPASSSAPPAVEAGMTDLNVPRAEKEGAGGEPTEETKQEEEAAAAPETTLLMKALGMQDSPVKIYGWIQNSGTYNANGTPRNDLNFGVNPNSQANRWMGNQYYLILEKPLKQNDEVNFGYRFDSLFGNDWQFNHMEGMLNNSFPLNHFAGWDPAQFYAEMHLPVLTKNGLDIRGGRFYTILGYEVVPAIGRPLLSVPYMFNYGQPFTHFGMMSTLHVTDRINWINATVNGWDRWLDQSWKWNYLGGFTWTSKDGKANLAVSYIFGPDQYPNFLGVGHQIVLPGATPPPYLAGRRNIAYGGNWRAMFTTVLSYKWTDKLTQVMETDEGYENNIPGLGVGGTSRNESWYSFGNWFLYNFTDKLTGVWRAEVFRDNGGARTGFSDNFYEQTIGLIWKPCSWLWVRPEARYDWAQFTHPYNDGTRNSQFTFGGDVIFLF